MGEANQPPSGGLLELCDLDRGMCTHGLQDRQGSDQVCATRLGSLYQLDVDCNVIRVPRAMSLDVGSGSSRMLSTNRAAAASRGREPCKICAGAARAWRR